MLFTKDGKPVDAEARFWLKYNKVPAPTVTPTISIKTGKPK